jgi:tripartite ATP-independent transporter DctP family solute receptor
MDKLSRDLPIIVEVVDTQGNVDRVMPSARSAPGALTGRTGQGLDEGMRSRRESGGTGRTRALRGAVAILSLACGLVAALPVHAAPQPVRIGVVTLPDSAYVTAANRFKEEVEKALPGKYAVEIHHSGALGGELDILRQVQRGTTQVAITATAPVESFVPEIRALEMPFLFPSYEAADKVLDGPIGVDLLRRLGKAGFAGLRFLDNGFRNVTNSRRSVRTPGDLKGLKIRTMESPSHMALWRALGADVVPMAWPIDAELRKGSIDGQENPVAIIHAAKLAEAGQRHLTLTRHVYSAAVIVANKAFMDRMSEGDRKVFLDAARESSLAGRSYVRGNEARQLAALEAAGVEVERKPDTAAFRAQAASVPAALSGDALRIYEEIRKAVR